MEMTEKMFHKVCTEAFRKALFVTEHTDNFVSLEISSYGMRLLLSGCMGELDKGRTVMVGFSPDYSDAQRCAGRITGILDMLMSTSDVPFSDKEAEE